MSKYDNIVKNILGNKKIDKFSEVVSKIVGSKPKSTKWIEKDDDKDGVINGLDCEPQNPKEQGIIHKTVNLLRGRGFQDVEYQKKQAREQYIKAQVTSDEEKKQKALEKSQEAVRKVNVQLQQQREREARRMSTEERAKQLAEKTDTEVTIQKQGPLVKQTVTATPEGETETTYKAADVRQTGAYKVIEQDAQSENRLKRLAAKAELGALGATEAAAGWAAEKATWLSGQQPKSQAIVEQTKESRESVPGQITSTVLDIGALGAAGRGLKGVTASKYISGATKTKRLAGLWKPTAKFGEAVISGQKRVETIGTGFDVAEATTRRSKEFRLSELKEANTLARRNALLGAGKEGLFTGKGLSSVSVFAKKGDIYTQNLYAIAAEKGYTGEQADRFVRDAKRSERVTGAKELSQQIIGLEASSERLGGKLVRDTVKAPVLWKASLKTGLKEAKNIAPIGAAEGLLSYTTGQKARGEQISGKGALVSGVLGGVSAGAFGGLISAAGVTRKISPTAGVKLGAGGVEKSTKVSGYLLDIPEKPGDLFYKYVEAPLRREKPTPGYNIEISPKTPRVRTIGAPTSAQTQIWSPSSNVGAFTSVPSVAQTQSETQAETESQTTTQSFVPTTVTTFDKGALPLPLPGKPRFGMPGFNIGPKIGGFTSTAKVKNLSDLYGKPKQRYGDKVMNNFANSLKNTSKFTKKYPKGKWM